MVPTDWRQSCWQIADNRSVAAVRVVHANLLEPGVYGRSQALNSKRLKNLEDCKDASGRCGVPAAASAPQTVNDASGHRCLAKVVGHALSVDRGVVDKAGRRSQYTGGFLSRSSGDYRCLG